jgi:hypothetical protein
MRLADPDNLKISTNIFQPPRLAIEICIDRARFPTDREIRHSLTE